jgi:hypothetical protein
MKKLVVMIFVVLLSVNIIGCSSSSSKYNENIDKIISYENDGVDEDKKLKRNEINVKVYEDVEVNAGAVQGKKTLYALQENKDKKYVFYFIKDTDGKVDEFGSGWDRKIEQIVSKPVYEEINIK